VIWDSITATNLNYFKKRRVEILRITEQETTDFENLSCIEGSQL